MARTWKEVRENLDFSPKDKSAIELEMELIRTMVNIREEQGLTQAQMADLCHVKQPVIARMESAAHSPQINSLLKLLVPLGYTLKIMPIQKKEQ